MTKDKVTHPNRKVAATRCPCCNRKLPTGEGTEVPFIGALGPECVQKFAPLVATLEAAQELEAQEWDRTTWELPQWAAFKLRGLGLSVELVEAVPGVKRLTVTDHLSRGKRGRARRVLAAFEDVRAEFEQRLMLAAADAQAAAEEALAEDLLFELEERAALQAEGLPGALPLALTDWLRGQGVQVDAGGEAHMPLPLRPADESLVQQLWQLGLDLGVAVRGRLDLRRAEYVLRVAGTVAA